MVAHNRCRLLVRNHFSEVEKMKKRHRHPRKQRHGTHAHERTEKQRPSTRRKVEKGFGKIQP